MKNYPTKNIRNILLLGHGGSGKTSLVEAMAFNAGASMKAIRFLTLTMKKREECFQFLPR